MPQSRRLFNVAGPCVPGDHYMLDPLRGIVSRAESVKQILAYMDRLGADAGWLVLFDTRPKGLWGRKIYTRVEKVGGKRVMVAGC